jgi:hypothetical protein
LPGFDELNRMSEPAAQSTPKSKDAAGSAVPSEASSHASAADSSAPTAAPVKTTPPVADAKPSPAASGTPSN